ncbi:MAG: homocysteine S-methyltransferase family protein [Candidatus Eisenbacteria bacterium]|nr:homocysteine S-methyltransferase family protein [Candidatus Eisenbacteria bacterium]
MQPLLERLKLPGVVIADGAMGTMLLERGLKPGDCPERINLERPDVLSEIARLYLEAGAGIVQTNTFGGSPLKLASYALDGRTEEINARAVSAVREVLGDQAYLSASCGPCGKVLEPYGDTSADMVFNSFLRQMEALIAEGVDMICIETMTDLTEATLAIKAARSVSSSVPVCATMTFDAGPRGFHTIMGTSIGQAIEGLTHAGADIIGSNCGNGILNMTKIAGEFIDNSALPIAIRPNAGLPVLKNGVSVYPESPEFMAKHSHTLMKMGVKIIGGCCGTTPEHIAALRKGVGHEKTR